MKITKTLQEKLESIFQSLGYVLRYERGNFRSGYCILEDNNVVVINKFLPLESRVNALTEILRVIKVDEGKLTPTQINLLQKVYQTELKF